MNRKDSVFLDIATELGRLGTCDRGQVGALIIKDGRCISWGYNGAPPGLPHCNENYHGWETTIRYHNPEIPWDDPRQQLDRLGREATDEHGCRNTTHAEANALAFAARQGISTDGATLYAERSPCVTCAKLLIAAGIKRVVYGVEYRDPEGLHLMERAGIQIG